MKFILQMAWRDSRASRRRLLLFSLSIVAGVAALVALSSGSASLERSVRLQAKGLLGADLVVSTRAPPSAALREALAGLGELAADESFSSMVVFPSAADGTHLVQVRAMEGGFPFYGDFVTAPADAASSLLRGGAVALLDQALLDQFGARVGQTIRLGRAQLRIAGAIEKLSGDSPVLSTLAPRVLIPYSALSATGLGGPGPLVRYRMALRLPPGSDADAVAAGLRARFEGERLSIETAAGRERELGRTLTNIYGYLGLAGFVALFLGAIGVASAIHVHVRRKLATVAVLRCLGASAGQGFGIYLAQGFGLGAAGSLAGAALGLLLQRAIPAILQAWLPFPVTFSIAWGAVARAAGAGWAICVLFALLPLLAVRRVPPLAALRSSAADGGGPRFDPWKAAIGALIFAAVAGFGFMQTHSRRLGLGFAIGLAAGLAALAALAAAVRWGARRCAGRRLPYILRQGVANLHRPQNRTLLLLVSLGLGTFLILTLYLSRATLLAELADTGRAGRPNLLFFDVQDDQIGALDRLASSEGTPVVAQDPIVAMRIAAVRGRGVEELLRDPSDRLPGWTLRREYRSTYRDRLSQTERIVAGSFQGRAGPPGEPVPISVEEGLVRDLRLRLGDEIDWDIQGVPIRSRVASVRAVEWRRLEPNFFVVFPAGVLEGAPQSYLAAVRAPAAADSARLQRAVAHALPNVTAVDLAQLQQTLDSLFAKVAFVVNFMAGFTVATGLAVLAGAVAASRHQRRREAVLLRALGASRRQLAGIQSVEYAALGLLAAVLGGGLALGADFLLADHLFAAPAAAPLGALLAALAAVPLLTLAVGRLADRGAGREAPLEALRQDE